MRQCMHAFVGINLSQGRSVLSIRRQKVGKSSRFFNLMEVMAWNNEQRGLHEYGTGFQNSGTFWNSKEDWRMGGQGLLRACRMTSRTASRMGSSTWAPVGVTQP